MGRDGQETGWTGTTVRRTGTETRPAVEVLYLRPCRGNPGDDAETRRVWTCGGRTGTDLRTPKWYRGFLTFEVPSFAEHRVRDTSEGKARSHPTPCLRRVDGQTTLWLFLGHRPDGPREPRTRTRGLTFQ